MAAQPPQYTPLATGSVRPGQNYPVFYGNSQIAPPGMERPLTYQEFLAARGQGAGNFQAPAQQQQPGMMNSAEDLAQKYGEKQAQDSLESSLFSSAPSAASSEGSLLASGAGVGVADAAGASTIFSGGTSVAGTAVGTAANGGTLMSTGAVVPASAGAPIASGGAAGAGASGAFSLGGIGSAGNVILPAAGALGAYDLYANQLKTGNKKRGVAQGAASGAAMGSYFGPWGALIGGVAGAGLGATAHESTRDGAKRHTGELLKKSNDPKYQAYVQGMRKQYESGPPDPSKPFAGKYKNFEEYKAAGLQADDLTGVMGNIETFGPEWANLSFDQQKAVTQKLIDANLYHSKKGEVLVSDKNKAKEIFGAMAKDGYAIPKASGSQSAPQLQISGPTGQNTSGLVLRDNSTAPKPVMIPRSKTKSPGIGMDGKPIPQWRR